MGPRALCAFVKPRGRVSLSLTVGPVCQWFLLKSRSAQLLSAVHRKMNGQSSLGRSDHEQRSMNLSCWILIGRKFVILESRSLLGCTRGPLDRESTVHVRCLPPAREVQTRRARFNVGHWIQDQRATLVDHARARARVSPVGLRRPIQDQRLTSVHVVLDFLDFPKD